MKKLSPAATFSHSLLSTPEVTEAGVPLFRPSRGPRPPQRNRLMGNRCGNSCADAILRRDGRRSRHSSHALAVSRVCQSRPHRGAFTRRPEGHHPRGPRDPVLAPGRALHAADVSPDEPLGAPSPGRRQRAGSPPNIVRIPGLGSVRLPPHETSREKESTNIRLLRTTEADAVVPFDRGEREAVRNANTPRIAAPGPATHNSVIA